MGVAFDADMAYAHSGPSSPLPRTRVRTQRARGGADLSSARRPSRPQSLTQDDQQEHGRYRDGDCAHGIVRPEEQRDYAYSGYGEKDQHVQCSRRQEKGASSSHRKPAISSRPQNPPVPSRSQYLSMTTPDARNTHGACAEAVPPTPGPRNLLRLYAARGEARRRYARRRG